MIPDGWSYCALEDIASVKRGKFSVRPRNDPRYFGGDTPFVQTGDVVAAQKYLTRFTQTLNEQGVAVSKVFPSGTILITIAANIGDTAITTFPVACPDSVVGIEPKFEVADVEWLNAILETKQSDLDAQAPQNAQKNINLEVLKPLQLLTPPFLEQRRIAEILATWDHAIETVEALIANARVQKNMLMQQLITGTKRLPGFADAWLPTTLDKAAQIIISNVDKKSDGAERAVRLCNYMDVYRSDRIEADMDFMAATATEAQVRKFGLWVGDVLITKDSETPDDIAIPSFVGSTAPDLVCGYHLAIIRSKKGADGLFLKFYFEHPHTRNFFASRANGATRFGLTIDAIQTAPIALPPLAEQQRIGEVIAAAELEIARLHPIAAALRQEKSALMQQLLTGKRRVKVDVGEETHA